MLALRGEDAQGCRVCVRASQTFLQQVRQKYMTLLCCFMLYKTLSRLKKPIKLAGCSNETVCCVNYLDQMRSKDKELCFKGLIRNTKCYKNGSLLYD